MDIVETTCATQVVFVTGPQSRVVQTAQVRVEKAVERVGVGDSLTTDVLYLLRREHGETDRGESNRGGKPRVQATLRLTFWDPLPKRSGCTSCSSAMALPRG